MHLAELTVAETGLRVGLLQTDRAVNRGPLGTTHEHPKLMRDYTFAQGHSVWRQLLDNLQKQYQDLHPRDRTEISVRRPFPP